MNARAAVGVVGLAAVLLAAAGSSTAAPATTEPTEESTAASGEPVADAEAFVERASGEVLVHAPTEGPSAATDQSIFVISVDQSLEGIVRQVDGVVAAGELIGWDVTVVDGKSSPDAMAAGIDRALSEQADGIVLAAINVAAVSTAADRAREAGIPIVSITSGSPVGPDGVFQEIGSTEHNFQMGQHMGNFVVADSQGEANVIVLNDTSFATAPPIAEGAVEAIDVCSSCEVAEVIDFTGAEIVTRLPELVRTALARAPEVAYVVAPYDAAATFAAQGVRDAGAASRVRIVSTGGNLANLDAIGSGDIQVMTAAEPLEFWGYLAVDSLNRAIADEAPYESELPIKTLSADNLPPTGEPWRGDNDWVAEFETLWGR